MGGRSGAAARLGIKRTTLIAKMKKLGVSRGNGAESICSGMRGVRLGVKAGGFHLVARTSRTPLSNPGVQYVDTELGKHDSEKW